METFLEFLGVAIALDIVLNGGGAISSIFYAIRGKGTSVESTEAYADEENRIRMIRNLIDEIDGLRDDLDWEISDRERGIIEAKITTREKILASLLKENAEEI